MPAETPNSIDGIFIEPLLHQEPQPSGGGTPAPRLYDGEESGGEKTPGDKSDDLKPDDKPSVAPEGEASGEGGEDLDDAISELKKSLGYEKKPTSKQAKPTNSEQAAKVEKPETKPSAKPDQKPASKSGGGDDVPSGEVDPETRAESTNVDAIAQAAARAAVEAANSYRNEAAANRPEHQAEQEDSWMSERDRRDLEVFKQLEADNQRYVGVSDKFKQFVKDLARYRERWEQDNPGEVFDPTDHSDFIERRQPRVDPDDFDEARFNVRAAKMLKQKEAEWNDRYSRVDAELAAQRLQPQIEKDQDDAIGEVISHVSSDLLSVIKDKGVEAFKESHPIEFSVLDTQASKIKALVAEVGKLATRPDLFRFDPRNPAHAEIDAIASRAAAQMKAAPPSKQVRGGKMFVTASEYRSIPDNQKGRYWTFDWSDIRAAVIGEISAETRERVQQEKARFESYLRSQGVDPASLSGKTARRDSVTPSPSTDKARSPSSASGPLSASANKLGEQGSGAGTSLLAQEMFGG